jgi:hypothetical protein
MSGVELRRTRKLPYPHAANVLEFLLLFTNLQKVLFLYFLDFTSTPEKDFFFELSSSRCRSTQHAQHG